MKSGQANTVGPPILLMFGKRETVLIEVCSKMGKINFLFPQKSKKDRTIVRNLGQIILIGNCTIARTVLIESVLLEDPL